MTRIYESGLAGALAYMWGYLDATRQVPLRPGLLVNAQNCLDHLLGDVVGTVSPDHGCARRWFLAELKIDEDGFHAEVHGASQKPKPHRTALYQHLRADPACRALAKFGHFAVWPGM